MVLWNWLAFLIFPINSTLEVRNHWFLLTYPTYQVLRNAMNATNASHSSAEHWTCGLGDVSVEFRIIYCQRWYCLYFEQLNLYWCQLAFWLQSREAQANIFPRDLGVALLQRQVFIILKKYFNCVSLCAFVLHACGLTYQVYQIVSTYMGCTQNLRDLCGKRNK